MNKEFLRRALKKLFWAIITCLGISLILLSANLNIFAKFYYIIVFCFFIIVLKHLIVPFCICMYCKGMLKYYNILKNKNFYNIYKKFKKYFKDLNQLHERRYKLFFSSGKTDEIKMLTEAIIRIGKDIIDGGNKLIIKGNLTETQRELIQDIIDETTLLLENESVNSDVTKSPN